MIGLILVILSVLGIYIIGISPKNPELMIEIDDRVIE